MREPTDSDRQYGHRVPYFPIGIVLSLRFKTCLLTKGSQQTVSIECHQITLIHLLSVFKIRFQQLDLANRYTLNHALRLGAEAHYTQ